MAKLNVVFPSTEVEVGGAKYRKVDRKAQEGDIIKITDEDAPRYLPQEAFFAVNHIDRWGDAFVTDEDGDDFDLGSSDLDYEVYEKVTEPDPVDRLKVGEYAKVVEGDTSYNGAIPEGAIVEIIEDDHGRVPFKMRSIDGEKVRWAMEDHVVRATEAEVAAAQREAKEALDPRNQFAVGDKVRLISGGGKASLIDYETGGIYTVKNPEWPTGKVEITGGGQPTAYAKPDQLEKVSAEELAEIERKKAEEDAKRHEEAKWASIGRKVNEYKAGDLVEITEKRSAAGVITGEICEVKETEFGIVNDGVRLTKLNSSMINAWVAVKYIKLTVPVEQRFDRVEPEKAAA